MKLIACYRCSDIISLRKEEVRSCHCGEITGQYDDDVNCTVRSTSGDKVIVIGFDNTHLINAIRRQIAIGDGDLDSMPYGGRMVLKGRPVEAFIIPDSAPSVNRE